jgi:cell division protein FtsX
MLFRIFKYSIKNSLRNKFLSISSILVLTLLMLFINILSELQAVSSKLIDSINSKLTISLYINENYTKTSLEITDFIADI